MAMHGTIRKMRTTLNSPVAYELPLGDESVDMNALIGKQIALQFQGKINCIQCNRETSKSFQQGYCFPCYRKLGECNLCMIHPERCLHGEGVCNPDEWQHANCMVSHVIYLANSSGLKVGITRDSQVPTRWIDQGAIQALPIFTAQNRYQSGILEVAMKNFVADKTNWRAMLKNEVEPLDLVAERDRLLAEAANNIANVQADFPAGDIAPITDAKPITIGYPVEQYPTKIKSFNFDKNPIVEGTLVGLKGQYLIFDEGVINVRKFGGYEISFVM